MFVGEAASIRQPSLPQTQSIQRWNLQKLPSSIYLLQTFLRSQKSWKLLTHWGRVTHICVSNLTIIGSNNGLLPGWRQAIIWTNAVILLIRTLGTHFSEILSEIHTFSFKKMHLKMWSGKWWPFCLGLNVLILVILDRCPHISADVISIKISGRSEVGTHSTDKILIVKQLWIKYVCLYFLQYQSFTTQLWTYLAPVPLSIFRWNSKFDENSKHPSVKCTWPITTIFCTRHDSITVVTCAKYRCDWSNRFETRAFWIFIEFRIRSKYA